MSKGHHRTAAVAVGAADTASARLLLVNARSGIAQHVMVEVFLCLALADAQSQHPSTGEAGLGIGHASRAQKKSEHIGNTGNTTTITTTICLCPGISPHRAFTAHNQAAIKSHTHTSRTRNGQRKHEAAGVQQLQFAQVPVLLAVGKAKVLSFPENTNLTSAYRFR